MKQSTVYLLIASLLISGTVMAQVEPSQDLPGSAESPATEPEGTAPPDVEPASEGSPTAEPDSEEQPAEAASEETPAAEPVPTAAESDLTVHESIDVEEDAPKHKTIKSWLAVQPRKKKGAIKGALKGAGVGLLAALVTGKNPAEGALIGAAAGALTGYLIGRRNDKVYAARDAAVAEIGYDPSQGYVMRIQEVRFEPPTLQAGESGVMHARYIIVGPDPKEKIVVQTYFGLKYDEGYISGTGPDKLVVRKGGGIIDTTVPVTIPAEAPAGSYTVEAMFDDPAGRIDEQRRQGPLYVNAAETEEATAS